MHRPLAVTAAVALAVLYGVVLVAVAALVLFEFVTSTGSIGTRSLDAQAAKGVLTLGAVLPLGAVILWRGSARLIGARDPRLLSLPLMLLLVLGCVGETVDLFGSATATSDLIGAGILVLAALPLALLRLPGARAWLAVGWVPTRR